MAQPLIRKHLQSQSISGESGAARAVFQIAQKLAASIYKRQEQYIFGCVVGPRDPFDSFTKAAESADIECVILESAESLQAVENELPSSTRDSIDDVRKRLEQGCIVVFARRPRERGAGKEVIGYFIAERGVFSALGRKGRISSDILFTHYMQTLPEYRGQRIGDLMRRAINEYCRTNGIVKRCAVIATDNGASIVSTLRSGLAIIGTAERVSVLRGLLVRETPWEKIESALSKVR